MIVIIIFVLILIIALCVYLNENRKEYLSINSKHVVITGGSSGIGKEFAKEASRLGAHVTIIGRDSEKLKAAEAEVKATATNKDGQKIQYFSLDVTSGYESISTALKTIEDDIAPIFMLVNCAGQAICGEFENMTPEQIDYLMKLNYFGMAYPTKYVLAKMKARGEGVIVLVSSAAALLGVYGLSAYGAAKWATRGLGESLLMELVGTGVNLTMSFPPDTDTPGFAEEEKLKPKETKLISGSAGLFTPEDVAKKLMSDVRAGRKYSVCGLDSYLLMYLFCSSIDSVYQVIIQVLTMGLLRLIMAFYQISFNGIIEKCLKEKKIIKNK